MLRVGQIINVKMEKLDEYIELHRKIWPEIKKLIYDCNIRNYSIYYKDGQLFSYFEYIGDNYVKDMEKMAKNSKNQEWWDKCKPCQIPLVTTSEGEWWASMKEIFHQD